VKKRRQDFFTILHFLFEIPSYGSVRKATTTILQNLTGGKKMKKRTLVILGLVLSLSLIATGSAFARWGGGYGMMGGKETLSLRDELVTKQLELRQEYNKETTDADRIAELRKDMIDIQTKIQKVAEKYDIDRGGQGRQARAGKGRGNADCRGGCY
jgi:hypothetical protein